MQRPPGADGCHAARGRRRARARRATLAQLLRAGGNVLEGLEGELRLLVRYTQRTGDAAVLHALLGRTGGDAPVVTPDTRIGGVSLLQLYVREGRAWAGNNMQRAAFVEADRAELADGPLKRAASPDAGSRAVKKPRLDPSISTCSQVRVGAATCSRQLLQPCPLHLVSRTPLHPCRPVTRPAARSEAVRAPSAVPRWTARACCASRCRQSAACARSSSAPRWWASQRRRCGHASCGEPAAGLRRCGGGHGDCAAAFAALCAVAALRSCQTAAAR